MSDKFEAVIGLEVHAQLLTDSKIFCGCSTNFGAAPNTNICPVCLGQPGVLPVLNKKVVEYTMLMGMATNCTINQRSVFARKNYFYPDLPKGYQISQYEKPICENGFILITLQDETKKKIGITRIHMEEDAGKSIHDQSNATLVDANRCGVPLIEIVSEPDIRNANEAYLYLSGIKQILQYIEICDGNMEEGSLRCDANISVRPIGENKYGTKTEVKNMNSFRNVERAINFEVNRQIEILEDGGKVFQQTLLWNAERNEAISMRSKEEAHDYRYFPEPDLMPVVISEEWKKGISIHLPELPEKKRERLITDYDLPRYDAEILTLSKGIADYFEDVTKTTNDYKAASNWIMGDVLKSLNETKSDIKYFPVSAENLGALINLINEGTISGKIAKDIFSEMMNSNKNPFEIVKEKNLIQISDTSELEKIIEKILSSNRAQVQSYLEGKEKVFSYFIGQIMKETKGKANPKLLNELLRTKLESIKLLN
jgi:aspartyl-tRNA(Asn)/glutamyl-tRNA(Gln) amidotransferase subunit B